MPVLLADEHVSCHASCAITLTDNGQGAHPTRSVGNFVRLAVAWASAPGDLLFRVLVLRFPITVLY